MTVALWPRIDRLAVDRLMAEYTSNPAEDVPDSLPDLPDEAHYASVGGSPVRREALIDLRGEILAIARECGLARDYVGRSDKSQFDTRVTTFLADFNALDSGEALRDDVWSCVTSAMVPEVTHWRFGLSPSRWHGGVRNTFQRLWMRGRTLDLGHDHEDRWMLIRELTEDALVQIEERPGVGAHPRIACAIAKGWVRTSLRLGRGPMETVMRDAVVGIRLQNAVVMLSAVTNDALDVIVDNEFRRAEAGLAGVEPELIASA